MRMASKGSKTKLSLRELRDSVGKTQAEVAAAMRINQAGVSKLEGRSDTTVSMLRSFVEALGAELEIVAVSKLGHRYRIEIRGR